MSAGYQTKFDKLATQAEGIFEQSQRSKSDAEAYMQKHVDSLAAVAEKDAALVKILRDFATSDFLVKWVGLGVPANAFLRARCAKLQTALHLIGTTRSIISGSHCASMRNWRIPPSQVLMSASRL